MIQETHIPLNKSGILGMLILSLVMIAGSVFVAAMPWLGGELPPFMRTIPPIGFIIIGGIGILFFGWCGISIFFKLFSAKTGLTINDQGIVDNSGGASAGMISWETVEQVTELEVSSQRFVVIMVSNPEEVIARQPVTKRFWLKANYKFYGSPVHISAKTLKIKHDELLELLQTSVKHI